jgi:uncharacterized SAM-dependent methyltransferase
MLKNLLQPSPINVFKTDVIDWFERKRHGHMGKWQYMSPNFVGDTCRGSELWDIWEQLSGSTNMLHRQKQIINDYAHDMAVLSGDRQTLIDLGPGATHAVESNTLPILHAFYGTIKKYISIDMDAYFSKESAAYIQQKFSNMNCEGHNTDFTKPILYLNPQGQVIALFNGGTIGNFEADPNVRNPIALMAKRITELKYNLPKETMLFIGLESTQDPETLYRDYDHPAHAEYEINVMHGIKRDLIPDEDGFNPYAWKYSMKWWPEAYQFCHIIEATEKQSFQIGGKKIIFFKGDQLVVDNSFKFPVLAMQRAVQMAGISYIKHFADTDSRMIIHAAQF